MKKKIFSANKNLIYKPSAADTILAILGKVINCPFEILLEMGKINNQLKPESARVAVHRLRKRNLIFCERRGKKLLFALTEEGEKAANAVSIKLAMAKPKKWDGKWRIIIFDVPEKLRGKRDLLRQELRAFGFIQIQKSVLAYPYPLPPEFIEFWENAGILKHCIIFETDKIYNSDILKNPNK